MARFESSFYLVALGANLGNAVAFNAQAIVAAAHRVPGRVAGMSRLYRTPAYPKGAGPDFVNAVLATYCSLPPAAMLRALHAIEARHGRRRDRRWGARSLDLDLLGRGAIVRPDRAVLKGWIGLDPERQAQEAPGELILPHPRLQDRAFVLVPLAGIAAGWRHPLSGRRVAEMVSRLSGADRREIRPLGAVGGVVNRKIDR
ncbi:2-amino-4-hydroxy-6-hydroxymethyldihydropteridine diphosphokinase [uncultured Jannaschia sp.]|uniref:2-amino-4-hydroxy-6- hydroxymethyldihydropteridine diphosphokinase n=1 Tax=uncultured Jannaschia sp. TaxID=293347 RepID=UPI0026032093|nr:2-amino-4-hydroxy-6-hydroxymethyldihydropteridine diphosphokinase [uncultured Jannaschia sp.]